MKRCLDRLCAASGSKVSLGKSRVYFSPNTNINIRDKICETLSMEATADLSTYLGVPMINGRTSKEEYQYQVERVDLKLAG